MMLAEMTWQQVNALDPGTVVLAPFGAMEQHGPHLPLETDAWIATELARRVDERCDRRLLVLPTQWLGLSTHHMNFSGTITASVETYLALATEIIGSIVQAGFTRILVLNAHGGNVSALDLVLTKCRLQFPAARIVVVTYWNAAAEELKKIRQSPTGGMGHACELETSLLLAGKPQVVRTDRAHPDGRWPSSSFLGKDMLVGGSASISRPFSDISNEGGVGDPRFASAEKGQQFFDAIVRKLAMLVDEIESGTIDEMIAVGN